MSKNTALDFVSLSPSQQARFANIVSYVRTNVATDPLALDYFLNALVATGPEDTADRIETWSGAICDEVDARERTALCHGNNPHADRIVRVPSHIGIIDADIIDRSDV